MSIQVAEQEMARIISANLLKLKIGQNPSRQCWNELIAELEKILIPHKSISNINKSFAAVVYSLPWAIRNEAEYTNEKEYLNLVADKIERYFGMLIGNEVPDDRTPGVPRVI